MADDFVERHLSYEKAYDHKIIGRIPIIIRIDARSFHRLTKKLPRPYCPKLLDIMGNTMLHTIMEIDGAVFGYHYNDEINFVLMPGDQPWYDNRIQKLCSVVSSLVSVNFFKYLLMETHPPEIDGDVIFDAFCFGLPSTVEVVNNLILSQQNCIRDAISRAALSELAAIKGKEAAVKILYGKKIEERINILLETCDIEYEEYYPASYRKGIAVYKVPQSGNEESKSKWIIDYNIPIFVLDKNFILNILHSGRDIFRANRDL